jgi:hypothetical protein
VNSGIDEFMEACLKFFPVDGKLSAKILNGMVLV